MINLGVDGYPLADGSEFRGIGTYLRNIIAGLAGEADFQLTVAATPASPLPEGVRRVRMGPPGNHRIRGIRHDLQLLRVIPKTRCDLFHSPAVSPPPHCAVPWVQTLHDLTPVVFRDPTLEPLRRRWLRLAPRVRRAAAVICDSQSAANQGIELLGLDPSRTHVVPLGVDPAFTPGPPTVAPATPYLLIVATWGPHKGFREAIAAIDAVAAAGYPHRLLIAGYQSDITKQKIAADVAAARFPERVEVLDHLPDLVDVYRGADLVLVPSHAEGFGLPALEAMACGRPVLAADATSLPEVVGGAGVLVPVGDRGAWGEEAVRVLADSSLRKRLGDLGVARAAEFTWQRTVAGHADVMRKVL